ncbi:TPA: VOC family protein [Escherichia coli]|nr:VOC family protein [Escherichia coli]
MDESRKQFEEWFENYTGCDHKNKIYANMVEMYWQAWQASRAAIEIELQKPKKGPLPGDYHIGYDSGAESQYESDVEAIRAAGIKVKE